MKQAIYNMIKKNEHTLFNDLMKIPEFEGNCSFTLKDRYNNKYQLFWPKLSKTAFEAIKELIIEKRINFREIDRYERTPIYNEVTHRFVPIEFFEVKQ